MTAPAASVQMGSVNIAIGGIAIEVISGNLVFLHMLHRQYADFVDSEAGPSIRLEVQLVPECESSTADEDVRVRFLDGCWNISRGDFTARYDPVRRQGVVRQNANRHSIDSVIRIIHTITLASESGFLVHSASAIRHGRAFLFAGRSGAGKTTLSRLAPTDACLLSDEVSYVRKAGDAFLAWGTPFTGELGTPGANRSAPVEALCFLSQAAENRLIPIDEPEALRLLLANVLFFSDDPGLVRRVFDCACGLVARAKVFRLEFTADNRAWELIQ